MPRPQCPSPLYVAAYLRMSTDLQKYSLENQLSAISAYAEAHGMVILRTFADDGRSGLTVKNRPGLRALFQTISAGRATFQAVLVLDVSRWGRFQNTDESAYYEFLCWKAGIRVLYVGEVFENDHSPLSTIVKGLKRAMAAEYSREMSVKAWRGHMHLARLGYRMGAPPGFGFRRMLLGSDGTRKRILHPGELKNVAGEHVTLVPGPAREVRIVRWMFEEYLRNPNCNHIARELNRRGVLNDAGRRWSCKTVLSLLDNEKYAGHLLYHRCSKKLAGPLVHNPKSEWVRVEHAHAALVPPELFAAVHRKRAERMTRVSNGEMLDRVRCLFLREGYLSRDLLDAAPGILSATVLHRRFGTLTSLYRKVGYVSRQKPHYANVRGRLTGWRTSLTGFLAEELDDAGSRVERHGWVLHIDRAWTVSFTVMHRQLEHGRPRWKNYRTNADSDLLVFARWASGEDVPQDYFILPRMLFPDMPRVFAPTNSVLLESFRFPSLAVFQDLARLSRMEPPSVPAQVEQADGEGVAKDETLAGAARAAEERFAMVRQAMAMLRDDPAAAHRLADHGLLRLGLFRSSATAANGRREGLSVLEGVVLERLLSAVFEDSELGRWLASRYPQPWAMLQGQL
ncbi:recombinase family protein [Luteibacter sp. CQ10]|uniref:recombinase family protein n=1 Tax=Luteibacter sp. CQ10 TaxID=2805821 RepID=UPI0034A43674